MIFKSTCELNVAVNGGFYGSGSTVLSDGSVKATGVFVYNNEEDYAEQNISSLKALIQEEIRKGMTKIKVTITVE